VSPVGERGVHESAVGGCQNPPAKGLTLLGRNICDTLAPGRHNGYMTALRRPYHPPAAYAASRASAREARRKHR
jgi:hypothetical protein